MEFTFLYVPVVLIVVVVVVGDLEACEAFNEIIQINIDVTMPRLTNPIGTTNSLKLNP